MEGSSSCERQSQITRVCDDDDGEMDMDLISKLPDELLDMILTSLSTEDLLKTSVLSKRWETLWMHQTNFAFDMRRFMNVPKELSDKAAETASLLMTQVLRNHNGPLESCRIHHFLKHIREGNVLEWIRYLVHHRNIKDLSLICEMGPWDYPKRKYEYYRSVTIDFPMEIFAGHSLRSLELNRYSIAKSRGFWDCHTLKTLKLRRVFVESTDINRILKFCSSLEVLVLQLCFNMQLFLRVHNDSLKFLELSGLAVPKIEVRAPNLDVLVLDDLRCHKQFFVLEAPNVAAFRRSYWDKKNGYLGYNISGSVKERTEAKESINYEVLTSNYGLLRHLGVMSMNVDLTNPKDAEVLSNLLRECDRLTTLEIWLKSKAPADVESSLWGPKFWERTKPFPCLDSRLESVSIYDFSGSEAEFAFASRFVTEGTSMKNMTIRLAVSAAQNADAAMAVTKLLNLPKASEGLVFSTVTNI